MIYKEYDCVGCEYCINCGRKEGYHVLECDECNDSVMKLYKHDGRELCEKCLLNHFECIDIEKIDGCY